MKIPSWLKFLFLFLIGGYTGFFISQLFMDIDPGREAHAREETKLAFRNREIAIERGDWEMKRFCEEVITWNAVIHLSPRFFEGGYGENIDWLESPGPPGAYIRIKDGTSYSELLSLAKERQVFGRSK